MTPSIPKKVDINVVLPRIMLNPSSKRVRYYNKKENHKPIFVIYAKDLNKYIIINGHNRYFSDKSKKKRKIEIIIKGFQDKTKFIPFIDWGSIKR